MHFMMTRNAGRFVLSYLLLSLLFAAATLALCCGAYLGIGRLETASSLTDRAYTDEIQACIILDPGHGGEDGGAVGVDGTLEKHINLQIARQLRDLLSLAGVPVMMTRSDDRMLYDPNTEYRGQKKMQDLRARVNMVKDTPGAILISIHQNSFTQTQYSGLQVYYSPHHADSARLAELIQNDVRQWLQPDNNRKIKAADSNIYLLDRSVCPAVLVECGFLSNPTECAKLGDSAYLRALSTTLFAAICEYLVADPDGT